MSEIERKARAFDWLVERGLNCPRGRLHSWTKGDKQSWNVYLVRSDFESALEAVEAAMIRDGRRDGEMSDQKETPHCAVCCEGLLLIHVGRTYMVSPRRRTKCKLYKPGGSSTCASFGLSQQEAFNSFVPRARQSTPRYEP